ncbi:MAG: S-layer homology domain-containing protein [bacterium]|nr:S-layer homology domain-containing protein [bacterium]
MLKKLISTVLSAAVAASMLPSALAFDTADAAWFSEDFEGENIMSVISGKENGWSYDGADGAAVDVWVGDNGSGSNSLRISNGDSWFKNIWTGLDLTQNIKTALTNQGKSEQEAENETAEVLGNDLTVSFKAKFETQGVSNEDQPNQSYVRVKDSNYNTITEIRTMDNRLCIRARNASGGELTDFDVKNIDVSTNNNEWHNFAVEYDFDKALCRVTVDGETAQTDSGEWIPLGTVDIPVNTLSAIGSMEFGEYWSGWWQCIYVDDLTINPTAAVSETTAPTAEPGKTEEILYSEDFNEEGVAESIMSQTKGWSYNSDNANDKINIEVSDKENTSNALRFSSTDWYKTMWLGLDLKENGIAKRTEAGESAEAAEAAVDKYLSEDMILSFTAKLDIDGISDNPEDVHESYIKVKNAGTAAITELHTKGNTLYLRGLGDEEYHEIKKINITKENTEYHNFEIKYSMKDNTYRLKVDGEPVAINGSEDIKAGAGEGEAVIGSLGAVELGHHWSGWWQRLILDDVKIVKPAADKPTATPTQGPTAEPGTTPTAKPTATPTTEPTPTPTPEAGIYYSEPFDTPGIEEDMKSQENGWSYGAASGHEGSEDISVDNYGSGDGKSLRFASKNYYKNVWTTLDLKQNGVYKLTESGKSQAEAQAAVDEYLSGNMKISFKAKFEQDGIEEGHTHEQYIRIKSADGHVITDLHLYNDSLELVGLNENRTANERYQIKPINWKKGANDWHNITVYFDKTRNAYMVEVDGEIFNNTPHGRWIPAGSGTGIDASQPMDMGTVSSIEFGHYWSGWWSTLNVDSLKISEYTPEAAGFEITNVSIKNQHDSTSISPGNKYDAVVYTSGGEAETIEKEWSKSTDGGATWEAMTEPTVPAGVNRIKVSITAVSKNGETAVFTKEEAVNPSGSIDYANILSENFEAAGKEREINAQTNGWSITGTSIQADVDSGFGGTANSLRFASTNSNLTSNLRLDFMQRGAKYESGDKIRLKFSYSFGLGNNDDTVNSTSTAYVRIKNTNGTAFTAIELRGETMSVVYYDDIEKKSKNVEIASGKSQVIDIWRNVELYLDTEINKYCILIDGVPIGNGDSKWFTPANSIVEGIGEPMIVDGIGSIDIGQENSAWWANTCIDNISLDKYYLPLENTFKVNDLKLENEFSAKQLLVCGAPVKAAAVVDLNSSVKEDTIVTDSSFTFTYKTAAGEEKAMTDRIIPYDAVSVKVSGVFKNAVGQAAPFEKEFSVKANTAPKISNLTVTGDFKAGSVLNASYVFTDTEAPDTDNTIISWYRSKTIDGDYKLITKGTKEYKLLSADVSGYIKVIAVPKDSYGAEGDVIEKILSSESITEFDEAWSRVNIETNPSEDTTSISLPTEDKSTGIKFTWKSSNTSVVSNSGKITQQSKATTVTLTAIATNAEGKTETRRFTISVPSKDSGKEPSYGGGGSSGGGGGGGSRLSAGYIPTPTKAPIETAAPSSDENNTPNTPAEGGSFPDVDADAWYSVYVNKLAEGGIVKGDEAGKFNPENPITRSEFLKMIVGIFNILDSSAECDFTDVPKDAWYYGFIASAVKFDIAEGVGDGSFHPSDRITRQDMAVIAARAARLSGALPEADKLEFIDSAEISDYAKESVAAMAEAGIISGSDGKFAPKDFATRAQAAKIISMLQDRLN